MDMTIKPAQSDLIVRDPTTGKPLQAAGEPKPRNSYWLRRLRDGDVVVVNDKKGGKS